MLSACSQTAEIVERPKVINLPDIPDELRSCPGMPTKPVLGATQQDVAEYLVLLEIAVIECGADLAALNAFYDTLQSELNT